MIKKWYDQASCYGMSSRLFDPFDVPPAMFEPPDDVKRVCNRCPVRVDCLLDALMNNDDCVRAGLTKRQRDALRRPRDRVRCPICRAESIIQISEEEQLDACMSCGITWRTLAPAS